MLEMRTDFFLVAVSVVIVAELRFTYRKSTFCKAFVTVFFPEELECNSNLFEFLMYIIVIR